MLKRDRTPDERKFDKLVKTGVSLLGYPVVSVNTEDDAPFPYVLFWGKKLGRKGQLCKVVKSGGMFSTIEFEDGFRHVVDNRAIRRAARCSSSSSSCSSPTS